MNTLAVIADPALQERIWDLVYEDENIAFHDAETGTFGPVDVKLVRSLGVVHADASELAASSESHGSIVEKARRYLKDLPPGRISELIIGGRFNLALLINSAGGVHLTRIIISGLCNFVRKQGAGADAISTFGSAKLVNAAASLFMEAEPGHRFLTPPANFRFSTTATVFSDHGTARSLDAELQVTQWQKLRDRMLASVRPDQEGELSRLIADVESERGSTKVLRMDGTKLDSLGIAQIPWTNLKKRSFGLMGQFIETSGVSLQAMRQSRGPQYFFGRNNDHLKELMIGRKTRNADADIFAAWKVAEDQDF